MSRVRVYAVIGVIFGIGLYFRTAYLERSLWPQSNYDEARNILVARHIVEYREPVWRGPQVGGANNNIQNSPFFYYLLASLWFLTRSVLGVAVVWAVIQSLVILVAYGVGRNLWDDALGVVSALLAAVFYPFIDSARNTIESNILPLLFYVFIWLMTMRRKSVATTCAAILVLVLTIFFYYAGAPVVIPGLVWVAYECIRRYKEEQSVLWLIAPFTTLLIGLAFWTVLTYARMPFDQFAYAAGMVKVNWSGFIGYVGTAARLLVGTLWGKLDTRLAVVTSLLMLLYLGNGLMVKRPVLPGRLAISWILFLTVSALGFFALHGEFIENYMPGIMPIVVILIAYGMRLLFHRHRLAGILGICGAAGIFFAASAANTYDIVRQPVSPFEGEGDAAIAIYRDIRNTPSAYGSSFDIKFIHADYLPLLPPDNWWGASPLWFTLEQRMGTMLVMLTDRGEYFARKDTGAPGTYYLFCDYTFLPHNRLKWSNACREAFQKRYEGLSAVPVKIYSSEESDVWRYRTAVSAVKPD